MYPTISHLIYDIFNINVPLPIQTFGLWVAIAFLLAGWVVTKELKRKENEGLLSTSSVKKVVGKKLMFIEKISSLLIGFAIGFKGFYCLNNYSEFVQNPQEIILSNKGNLEAGILISILYIYLKWKDNKKNRLETPIQIEQNIHPYQLAGNMIMIAAISGIIGAKIFHNLENINLLLSDPLQQLISFSGLSFYGGLITGAICVIWYANKHKINIRHLVDCFAPALILSYGVGRIGCHMSGDGCWGIDNINNKPESLSFLPDWMWSYSYPHNVISKVQETPPQAIKDMIYIEGSEESFWYPFCYQLENPVFPTALYEAIISISIFIILWQMRKHIKIPGLLFCFYLVVNGLERFFIEKFRINPEYNILGGITQAEIISLCLIITGGCAAIYLYKEKHEHINE